MDIQKYIASGILEQYILGNTTETESREVEQYVKEYPEIAAELMAIQEALESWAKAEGRQPRAGLEEELMKKVEASTTSEIDEPASPATKSGLSLTSILIAGLLLALGLLIYQFLQYQEVQEELNQSQTELEQLKEDCDALQDSTATLINYANIVGNPNSQHVSMLGLEIAPSALASVYWNPDAKKSYLEIKNLPPPPTDMQYQLWAIVDGAPVDMGVFNVVGGLANLQEVPFIDNPQAFAVTLEQRGGSPTPTLEQMYVVGNRS